MYKNHVISTANELLTSGFRTLKRPDHMGCDFVDAKGLCNTLKGVDILAFADGKVVEVIKGQQVGNTVAISHEGKILTRYQHMRDRVKVKVGDTVKKGQVIGVMGNTGYCTSSNLKIPAQYRGTHLHFGVKENSTAYNNGTWVNPELYLNGEKEVNNQNTESEVNLMSKEYDELKKMIEELRKENAQLKKSLDASIIKYGYVDNNMPAEVRPTIDKLVRNKIVNTDKSGKINLNDNMCRLLTILDKKKVFD